MAYTGQPVPTTVYNVGAAKISDGKSVRVSVPANSGEIKAGDFVYFGGFLGVAMQSLANDTVAAQDLILQIEVAEYETDQTNEAQEFKAGTKIYWDNTNKEFTETPTAIFAGVVTAAKDDAGVIWFVLMPGIINDAAAEVIAAEVIGELTTLTTTEKGSVVGAINEVNTAVGAAAGVIGDLDDLTTTEKDTVVEAINEVDADATAALARVAANVVCAEDASAEDVRTALRGLLAALETAGLMAAE